MAVRQIQQNSSWPTNENTNDISRKLPSLQFESAVTDEERKLLFLRPRSHAITVAICGHSVFIHDILSKVRLLKNQIKSSSRKTAMILQDVNDRKDELTAGILGGGRLGSQIAHSLLTFSNMNPLNLKISTRRPETLEYLQHKGVECYYNNKKLVSSVHLLFICVLPSQLLAIAEEIKGHLSPFTVVYCPSASTPLQKIQGILKTSNVLKSDFQWTEDSCKNKWDYNVNVKMSLEEKDVVDLTNPINQAGPGIVVFCNERLAEMIICTCVNMATAIGLSQIEMVTCLNIVILGDSSRAPVPDHIKFTLADFNTFEHTSLESCPMIDLSSVEQKSTKLQEKIKLKEFIEIFNKRYSCVFDEFHHLISHG